jgi:hypothetical protein
LYSEQPERKVTRLTASQTVKPRGQSGCTAQKSAAGLKWRADLTGAVQGDLGRNALRGFGAAEVDLTLRRQFKIRERLALQARADFFNIFNHPNFGPPINYLSSPLFGQSTQMLGASLGSGGQNGGLNPLYQIGGPRSVQLALKLLF